MTIAHCPFSFINCPLPYGTSIDISLPEKLKFGRLRPFINFAAVCDRAVIIIGKAIDGSHATNAVVADFPSLPNCCV
jgi:hypothetical protein